MSDIFVSYASGDRPRAQMLATALEDLGWSVFWDRTIPTGRTWRQVIGKELEDARCVIVLWSEASIASTWVQEEADDANRRNILLPVLIGNVLPPIGFRSIQAADLSDWDAKELTGAFKRLLSDIATLIGPAPKEAARKRAEAKRKTEEDEKRRQAEAEAKRKAEEEEKRRQAEAQAKRKAEEKEKRRQAEAEAKRKAEEEKKRRQAEAEAKRKAEEEKKRRQAEAAAKRKAAEESSLEDRPSTVLTPKSRESPYQRGFSPRILLILEVVAVAIIIAAVSYLILFPYGFDEEAAFVEAAKNNNLRNVQGLIKRGVDPDAMSMRDSIFPEYALTQAAANGHIQVVRELIQAGANIEITEAVGMTALMKAAAAGHIEVVSVLVEAGAELDKRNSYGETALVLAAAAGQTDAVNLLIQSGANPNIMASDSVGMTALMKAASVGMTALMKAAAAGHIEVVSVLVEAGAELDKRNYHGDTALMFAAAAGQTDAVNLLIQSGANLNIMASDSDGFNALMYAAIRGYADVVQALVNAGAYINDLNQHGKTALQTVQTLDFTHLWLYRATLPKVIEILKAASADQTSSLLPLSKPVYVETFSDDPNRLARRGWRTGETVNGTYEISDGSYRIDNRTDGLYLRSVDWTGVVAYKDGDYMIECFIERLRGEESFSYALLWGSNVSADKLYAFHVTGNGNYRISKYENGWEDIVEYTQSNHINKGNSLNKLTIVKGQDSMKFFVNNSHVKTIPSVPLFGTYVGFGLDSQMEISIKEVVVRAR